MSLPLAATAHIRCCPLQLTQSQQTQQRQASRACKHRLTARQLTRSGRMADHSLAASAWQETATDPDSSPTPARSGHCAAALPPEHSGDVLIFGGYTEDSKGKRQAANDAWVYSCADKRWTQLQSDGPTPRVRIASQAVVVGSKLWLLAGWDPGHKGDGGDILSDIWSLDLTTGRWEEIKPQGAAMPAISRFQAAAVGSEIFIHNHRSTEAIHVLDTSQQPPVLSERPYAGGEAPSSRGLHSLTLMGDTLWLFGGAPKQGAMLDDLWALDTQDLTWRQVPKGQGTWPHARCSQAVAAGHDGKIYLQGGSYYKADGSGLEALDDLWVLDTAAQRWQQLGSSSQGGGPSPRNAAVMVAAAGGRQLVHHAGWLPFKQTYCDTWVRGL